MRRPKKRLKRSRPVVVAVVEAIHCRMKSLYLSEPSLRFVRRLMGCQEKIRSEKG